MENLEEKQPLIATEQQATSNKQQVTAPKAVSQSPKPLVFVFLSLVMFVLGGGLVFAYFRFLKPQKVMPQPTVSSSPSPALEVSPVPVPKQPTPTLSVEEQTKEWEVYRNERYGYSIKYPPGAEVKEFGYPNKNMCVYIKYKLTSITIASSDAGGTGCMRTGFGYEAKEKEESISIGGKEYTAQGIEEIGPGETLNVHNETLRIKGGVLGTKDRLALQYGSTSDESATYDDYLKNKKYIRQILSTLRFLD